VNINELRESLAQHVHDLGMEQVNARQLLIFINDAARDASQRGWLIPLEEDESIVLASGTYDYDLPADFFIVVELQEEGETGGTFDVIILPHEWRLVLDTDIAKIRFDKRFSNIITDGRALKVLGYHRPSSYVEADPAPDVDAGIESFLRERATSYAARYLAHIAPEQAQNYDALFNSAYTTSQDIIATQLLQQAQDLKRFEVQRRAPGR